MDQVTREYERNKDKLQFSKDCPQAKWISKQDLQENGEEARRWAKKIFTLIECLAEEGWKLNSFWNRNLPVVKIIEPDGRGFGEAEYIHDVCEFALGKLKRKTFCE